jgi:hypothetical protein
MLAMLATAVGAQADDISLVGYWEVGSCYGLDLQGGLTYHGDGSHLDVVDLADPLAPVLLGSVQLRATIDDVAVVGTIAYVADSYWGLQIVDVTDPAAPVVVGGLDIGTKAASIAVAAGFAYLVDTYDGLFIIDVADPAQPAVVQHLAPAPFPQDIWVGNGRALLATWNGIFVYDVTDPAHPVQRAVIPEGAYYGYEGITSRGDLVFAASGQGGLRIWDLSNPCAPVFLDDQNVDDEAIDVDLQGDHAVVSCRHSGLRVIDVSNPHAMVIVGELDPPGGACEVLCRGGLAYLASSSDGVQVIDLADPTQPRTVGASPVGGAGVGVQVRGGIAHVAEVNGGLRLLDLMDPARPTPVGYCRVDDGFGGIAVQDGFAYVACDSGVRVFAVADPTAPREVSLYAIDGGCQDIAIRDNLVCCTNAGRGLVVLDVADPAAPELYGTLDLPGTSYVAMGERYTYYAVTDLQGDGGGLYVVDHTVPGVPAVVGRLETPKAMQVAVAGERVFFYGRGSSGEVGLVVADVSDPTSPREIGFLPLQWPSCEITASGDYAYIYQMFEDDLLAVDVTDPAAPRIVAEYARPGWYAHCLQADRGTIYANGVWVLKHESLTGCQPPLPGASCHLEPVWPNPFNPATSVAFSVPQEQRVQIDIYSPDGRLVCRLCDRTVEPGRHVLSWAGTDARGRALPSGVYLVRLATEGAVASQKVTLMR